MNSVSKTLYIPLYGKSYVSKRGLFINDEKAEEIWEAEGFSLKGKSKSKWLAYYMGIRSAVFDEWLKCKTSEEDDSVIIHIGCGMDSRALRVGTGRHKWYDVDFPEVITERKRYFSESNDYKMIEGDVRESTWITEIKENGSAIVVMEGVSMYLTAKERSKLTKDLCAHFRQVSLLNDCYTTLAAKLSKYKNPVNEVGVSEVYGTDDPKELEGDGLTYVAEHNMTPEKYIDQLSGLEKFIFKKLYAGSFSKKLYRLFEYEKI